ncbi:MAG: Hsp20/alpha crystallin family protein [Elusimicrobia bacterium]|nr:Hsp20/alpha crystallin family protein [Elusimicrobiota bacterium]
MKTKDLFPSVNLGKEIESFFEDGFFPANSSKSAFKTDISQDEKEVTVKAEIPGADKKDIKAEVIGNSIKISFEKKQEREEKGKNGYFLRESSCGFFSRTLPLPAEVISQKAKASYKDGILKIVLPKKNPGENKSIKIN